jgi:hypothetical protein
VVVPPNRSVEEAGKFQFDRTVRSNGSSWPDFKLTEPFGHELLIAIPNKCSPRFNRGRIEMAASYESFGPAETGWMDGLFGVTNGRVLGRAAPQTR